MVGKEKKKTDLKTNLEKKEKKNRFKKER